MSSAPSAIASVPILNATAEDKLAVVRQMEKAIAAHDVAAFAACFTADYRSEQPAHPARAFRGADGVREHWTRIFQNVPDIRQETVATATNGDTVWMEIAWRGRTLSQRPFEVRGVIIAEVRGGRIAAARLFLEPVEEAGESLAGIVDHTTR
jgi:ketosteroid isomerase-like protein